MLSTDCMNNWRSNFSLSFSLKLYIWKYRYEGQLNLLSFQFGLRPFGYEWIKVACASFFLVIFRFKDVNVKKNVNEFGCKTSHASHHKMKYEETKQKRDKKNENKASSGMRTNGRTNERKKICQQIGKRNDQTTIQKWSSSTKESISVTRPTSASQCCNNNSGNFVCSFILLYRVLHIFFPLVMLFSLFSHSSLP